MIRKIYKIYRFCEYFFVKLLTGTGVYFFLCNQSTTILDKNYNTIVDNYLCLIILIMSNCLVLYIFIFISSIKINKTKVINILTKKIKNAKNVEEGVFHIKQMHIYNLFFYKYIRFYEKCYQDPVHSYLK
jgi:hypothetical protein